MSGFVGIVHLAGGRVERARLEEMTDFLSFRAPDGKRVWLDGAAGLGHTFFRTTTDSMEAGQPCSLDGQVWIAADARLDGRADLTAQLGSKGRNVPETASDAELILHAYHVWGEDSVHHLMGDFSFALWDRKQRRLFCVRDHFGIKPFYYASSGDVLIFSNTLECLRRDPEFSGRLNELAIADFLVTGVNQEPDTTSFADIHRLPPASVLLTSPRDPRLSIHCYWTLTTKEALRYRRREDYVEHFNELLNQAVNDRLRNDCVGVLMSGGLDSTSVAVTAHDLLSERDRPFDLRAWTFVYDHLIPDEERYYSGLVAKWKGFPIRHFAGDSYEPYEKGLHTRYRPPEPTDAPLASSFFEQFPPDESYPRVVLTGQGGDPALAPSSSYLLRLAKRLHIGRLLIDVSRYALEHHRLPPFHIRANLRKRASPPPTLPPWLNREHVRRLELPSKWEERLRRGRHYDCARQEAHENLSLPLWASLFECYDAGATGFLTELRHPYFDLRLMNFLLALPGVPWCVDKQILREAMRGRLPEAVRCRRKAPLAGYPEYEKIRASSADVVDTLAATPGLDRFVEVDRFLRIAQHPERLRPSEYTLITRPLSLAVWLQQLESSRAGLRVREKHEVKR